MMEISSLTKHAETPRPEGGDYRGKGIEEFAKKFSLPKDSPLVAEVVKGGDSRYIFRDGKTQEIIPVPGGERGLRDYFTKGGVAESILQAPCHADERIFAVSDDFYKLPSHLVRDVNQSLQLKNARIETILPTERQFENRQLSGTEWNISDAAEGGSHTEVRNGYTYTIDESERTTQVSGELTSNSAQIRNVEAQLSAGGLDRLETDEGGHFIGRRFDGPLDDFNHFAQDINLNRGAYKALENSWQRALDAGQSVFVDIKPTYAGDSMRPSALEIKYTIDSVPYRQTYFNRPGG